MDEWDEWLNQEYEDMYDKMILTNYILTSRMATVGSVYTTESNIKGRVYTLY